MVVTEAVTPRDAGLVLQRSQDVGVHPGAAEATQVTAASERVELKPLGLAPSSMKKTKTPRRPPPTGHTRGVRMSQRSGRLTMTWTP